MPWLRTVAGRFLLPAWFAVWSITACGWPLLEGGFGTDAEIYHRAATVWLSGGSPWDASSTWGGNTYHFYALPPTVLLLAPFSIVPELVFVPGFVALQAAAAVYVLRRLGLRWWWLMFPPISVGIVVGNPSITLIALLLAPHDLAKALAPLLKVYAALPLVGERQIRPLILAALLTLGAAAITAGMWADFLEGAVAREARLMVESSGGYSAYGLPLVVPLMAVTVLALARYDFKAAGWLAPIAIWPASQLHWSTLALPVMTPTLAVLMAINLPGAPALAIALHTLLVLGRRIRELLIARRET